MRVAVIGAGLSGLAAARRLADLGASVVVFEKSRGLGGRIASRRVEGTVVDHGAPALDAAPGSPLADLASAAGGALRVTAPARGDSPADAPMAHPLTFADGLTRVAKHAAEGVEVVRGVRIAALRGGGAGYELGDEQGNGHGRVDAVVVSAPAPQAADLLERSPEPAARVEALRAVTYHPAVMLVAGLRAPAPEAFLVHPGRGDLATVAVQSHAGRPPVDGVVPVVARLTPAASAAALDAASDEDVWDAHAAELRAALGVDGDAAWWQVKRWRHCTVAAAGDADALNPGGTRIVLCGDGLTGSGMAAVHASGVAAAEAVAAALRP